MNEATLRRLQERMAEEGFKQPSIEGEQQQSMNPHDDPAVDGDCATTQHRTIYTEPTHPSTTNAAAHEQQQQQEEDPSERYARQLEQQARRLAEFGNDSTASEELWKCDRCGYDSTCMHQFCGLCGSEKPEDWWCTDCHHENSFYHRFCPMCGMGRPEEQEELGYEDLDGLDADDEAAIEQTAARLSRPSSQQSQWDDDDVLTFCDDCTSEGAAQAQHHQAATSSIAETATQTQPQEQQSNNDNKSTSWSCEVCTFLNENPLFMCCELCGSARPAEVPLEQAATAPDAKKTSQPQNALPRRESNGSDSNESKHKEKRITDLMRQHQMQQFQQEQQASNSLPEPETDHELALIYAQQERILAQYQQQQQQR